MGKNMDQGLVLFVETVPSIQQEFVLELHNFLSEKNCKCEIKSAKSGYVVSYINNDTKRTLANFVTRKSGIKIRMYLEHIMEYEEFLSNLPVSMKKDIVKASVCKRLINPDDCNPKCVQGYTFHIDGESYQKCRYMAFMPTLSAENYPFILNLLEEELSRIIT